MFSHRLFWRACIANSLLFFAPLAVTLGQITTPEAYFGYKPGGDFHLLNYEQAIGYFELLASQTDRIKIFDMGPTSEGRRMKYGIVSSEANLANLERYKEINRKLTMVRGVSEIEAQKLAEEGKVVVWIDGGLHANEVAPAQHLPQLAYDLITGTDWRTQLIRERVIVILVFANPDGMTLVSDWYMDNVGTPYEVSPLPWLYHKYAGHDNNRDAFMANLIESQNMNRVTAQEWMPEILYNHHQTSPFPARIWIPPDAEPTNPNVHPLIVRWKNLIGSVMGKAFDEAGQPGAISRVTFDTWYPGYATQVVDGHNTVSILTETGLYRYATPHYYTLDDFPESQKDLIPGAFYPSPWQGGWWRLGDAVAYCLTASKAVLEAAAKFPYEFLYNKYRIGADVIHRFQKEPPYGWIISADQNDPSTAALFINRLILNGVEVEQADEPFVYAGVSFPQGTYIVPGSQPFAFFAKNILEKQNYPDLRKYSHLWQGVVIPQEWKGDPLSSYDAAGWTLPVQMGVSCLEMRVPLKLNSKRIEKASSPEGKVLGSSPQSVFTHTDNQSFTALNKIQRENGIVRWALDDFTLGGKKYSKGTFLVNGKSLSLDKLKRIASETGITFVGGKTDVESKLLSKPRIALYKSWTANMDAGWITFLFDMYDFPYHLLTDADVRAGKLRDRFDVIVLPDQRAASIIEGHHKGTMPPDYVGGITRDGVDNLRDFVTEGGTLVCNGSSSDLPIKEFHLPIKNVLEKVKPDSFNCPGSLIKVNYDTDHPVAFGMMPKGMAFFSRGHVYELVSDTLKAKEGEDKKEPEKTDAKNEKEKPKIVASYPDEPLLISGWILGDKVIQKKAAIVDVPFGKGKIILFGFNVHNRAQAYSCFKLLFNAMYY